MEIIVSRRGGGGERSIVVRSLRDRTALGTDRNFARKLQLAPRAPRRAFRHGSSTILTPGRAYTAGARSDPATVVRSLRDRTGKRTLREPTQKQRLTLLAARGDLRPSVVRHPIKN